MNNKHAIVFLLSIYLLSCRGTIDYISTITVPMNPKIRKQNEDTGNWTSDEISKLNRKEAGTQSENDRLNELLMLQASLNRYRELSQEYQSWIVELAKDKQGGAIPSKITERSALLVNEWDSIQKSAQCLGCSEKNQK